MFKLKLSATKPPPFFVFFFMLLINLAATNASAEQQTKTYSESQIKVALVYKLMHFVTLPESNPLTLCVYKPSDEDTPTFQLMPPKTQMGSELKVKLIKKSAELLAPNNCQIVFFSAAAKEGVSHRLSKMAQDGFLTIGETEQFIKQGGMINLVRKGSTVKFEVNLSALKQAGLNISSQVLRIADQVYTEDGHD